MSASPFQSPRSSRARYVAVITALVAVGISARSGDSQPTQPPAKPTTSAAPATPASTQPVGDSAVVPDSNATSAQVADSLALQDSLAPTITDSIQPDKFVAATPAAPAAWPVDPATGQTLINGRPVVGRVFIMQKLDGLKKLPDVATLNTLEAAVAAPPVVGTSYTPAPITHQRRHRGIMVQATLWSLDNKRSAVRLRNYGPSTPANELSR